MQAHAMRYMLVAVLVCLALAGCSWRQTAPAPEPNQRLMDGRDDTAMMQADDAVRMAEAKEGVDRAYAVVSGPGTILVGLVLDEDVSDERAAQIEDELSKELPQQLSGVTRVMVSSNPDVAERIREIGRGVREGRPLSEFADELEDLTERMMPQTGGMNGGMTR